MMIDPSLFPSVAGIVLLAVVLVLIDDVLITAVVSYFMGYTSRQAVTVSTSLCARGAESSCTPAWPSTPRRSPRARSCTPWQGAFTSSERAVPLLMRRSDRIADALARRMPHFIKYSAAVVARTLSKLIMPV
jgi:hypothetical protein